MMNVPLPDRSAIVTTSALAVVISALLAFSQPATLRIDGQKILSDVPPVTQVRNVFVPIRAVASGLGAETLFDKKTGIIQIARGSDIFKMQIGSHTAYINGNKMTVKHAPFTVRGHVMIGAHALSRALGTRYHYDAARATIDITTPGVIEAGAQELAP